MAMLPRLASILQFVLELACVPRPKLKNLQVDVDVAKYACFARAGCRSTVWILLLAPPQHQHDWNGNEFLYGPDRHVWRELLEHVFPASAFVLLLHLWRFVMYNGQVSLGAWHASLVQCIVANLACYVVFFAVQVMHPWSMNVLL